MAAEVARVQRKFIQPCADSSLENVRVHFDIIPVGTDRFGDGVILIPVPTSKCRVFVCSLGHIGLARRMIPAARFNREADALLRFAHVRRVTPILTPYLEALL